MSTARRGDRFVWSANQIEIVAPAPATKLALSELEWATVFAEIAARYTGSEDENSIDGGADDGQPVRG
jgi:hypothetical protein